MSTGTGSLGRVVNSIEEGLIALLLGSMTLITFVNVVMRYLLGDSILWGLEPTTRSAPSAGRD